MRGFLLVSHGGFAEALKESVKMIAGEVDNIFAVGLYPSEGVDEFIAKLDVLVPEFENYEELFIFTDLFGGSPGNSAFLRFAENPKFQIISGMNFPLVLTALLTPDVDAQFLLDAAKEGMVDVKAMLSNMDDE